MHEISLVQNLLQQLDALVLENKKNRVTKVLMEIGLLSGVVVDSFQFGFDIRIGRVFVPFGQIHQALMQQLGRFQHLTRTTVQV